MTDRDTTFAKALDLIKDHDALAGEANQDLRAAVFQKYVEDAAQDHDRALKRATFWHNTPLMVALTGLLTIAANFAVNYTRAEQDLSGLLTKSEFDAAIQANNDRLSAELAEERAQADAARSADGAQRAFQYQVLTELLDIPDEETRARLLLFYVDAGAMEGLSTGPLRAMAKQSIADTGGDPEAQVGVPTTREVPDRFSLLQEVLGDPGTEGCDIPLRTVPMPEPMLAASPALRQAAPLRVHAAAAPYAERLLRKLADAPTPRVFPQPPVGYAPLSASDTEVTGRASWGASVTFFVGASLIVQLGNPLMPFGRHPDAPELTAATTDTGYRLNPTLLNLGIIQFELTDDTLREIQASGYIPWDGTCQ
ncbi:MAG: hypothetical protein AAFQ19_04150 [Pseudomonadota bacterium]